MPDQFHKFRPELLENELVKLIPLEEADFEKLYTVASDPLIWEQHPSFDRYQKKVFKVYFDDAVSSQKAFLIYDNTSNELIGSSRFYDYKESPSKSIAIGYTFLATKNWGGKYNLATKKLLIEYAFQFVNAVIFHIGSTNIRSQKAILKIGAKKTKEYYSDPKDEKSFHFEYEIQITDWIK